MYDIQRRHAGIYECCKSASCSKRWPVHCCYPQVADTKATLAQANSRITDLNGELRALNGTVAGLTDDKARLAAELAAAKASLEGEQREKANVAAAGNSAAAQAAQALSAKQAELDKASDNMRRLAEQVAALTKQLEAERKTVRLNVF